MAAIQDTVTIPKIVGGSVSGPASYATGGFLLDLSATFSFLRFLSIEITTFSGLECDDYEIALNQNTSGVFSPGQAVIKLLNHPYDKFSVGNVTGNPGGTAVQAALFAAGTTTGSSHVHDMTHGHSGVSSTPVPSGGGVATNVGGDAHSAHTHDVLVPDFAGNTGAATHTHNRDYEYDHVHSRTNTETTITPVEVGAGTNISSVAWKYFAVGD